MKVFNYSQDHLSIDEIKQKGAFPYTLILIYFYLPNFTEL